MSTITHIRSQKILELINKMYVDQKDIVKSGYYTFRFKDRHGNNLVQEFKLNPCQRVVTYSHIADRTNYDKFKVRRSLIALEKEGKIKLKKIYKIVKGWVTKEIIGHIVTLVPVSITIKPLSLEKRKIEGINISQKSVTPRDHIKSIKSAKNATLNIYLNNNNIKTIIDTTALGVNIKSKDIDILSSSEIEMIEEFKIFSKKVKETITKIRTLAKQKKSELSNKIKITIISNKQNIINQKSNPMNLSDTSKISKATSFDINPLGKKITLDDKDELKAVRVDENNLIPAKYKNQFLDMDFDNQKKAIELYESLNFEIKLIDTVEKRKLISSIMIKFWTNKLSFQIINSYLDEIRKIRSNHYKGQRVIYDYWGLFNSKVGAIGNKVELGYYESQQYD